MNITKASLLQLCTILLVSNSFGQTIDNYYPPTGNVGLGLSTSTTATSLLHLNGNGQIQIGQYSDPNFSTLSKDRLSIHSDNGWWMGLRMVGTALTTVNGYDNSLTGRFASDQVFMNTLGSPNGYYVAQVKDGGQLAVGGFSYPYTPLLVKASYPLSTFPVLNYFPAMEVKGGYTFNPNSIGLNNYNIHISPLDEMADNSAMGITFGANKYPGNDYATTPESGIYVQTSSSYGSKMFLATTNSYSTGPVARMMIDASGTVGIGTNTPSLDSKLDVNGKVYATKMFIGVSDGATSTKTAAYELAVNGTALFTKAKVKLYSSWPDYVFSQNYKLLSLKEIEKFITTNQHLPEVPSSSEVEKNGIDLGDNQTILLKKVEELTLYLIEQNKKIEEFQELLTKQNKKIELLEQSKTK